MHTDSVANFNIYGAIGSALPEPRSLPTLPFPLENIDVELADVYAKIDNMRKRIEVTKRDNVRNLTPGIQKDLSRAQYKLSTCMSLLRELAKTLDKVAIP